MFFLLASIKDNVLKSLDIFWKGMLAVAIVILVIYLVVVLLNFCSNKAAAAKKRRESENVDSADNRPDGGEQ